MGSKGTCPSLFTHTTNETGWELWLDRYDVLFLGKRLCLTFNVALIFSYFEILLRLGNPTKFKDEIENLKHINTILSRWYSEDTYVDWWEDTMNLLQATAESLSVTGDAVATLVTAFNDGYTASALIQYFRVSFLFVLLRVNRELLTDCVDDCSSMDSR